jgi:hypothetical protein
MNSTSQMSLSDEDRPSRTREVDHYLARHGHKGAKLFKGPGFFCFEGEPTEDWIDHTVNVSLLKDLTLQQWLATYRSMDSNPTNRKGIRAVR